ncbi:MarR family winged helix-turn-helix transcriptional regulator [Lysinibacillus sp. NPDC097195]|uniref:MarR family winged helix-turn-helix transcriptional regulator n=1 Tax=Lysinibacillus sp. NPDC097195 TaxID=3364141 RepID=UPI00380D8E13
MDKNALFNQFVTFTATVHQVTSDLTQNIITDAITPVQYKILEYLKVSQPVTITEISDCHHMSLPNTSRELKKLQEKHLIEKISDSEDRRKYYVRLSEDGEQLMNEAFARVEARFQQLIQHVSEEDLKEIQHALNVLQQTVFQQ